jgi:LysM repeat protein
VLVVGLMIGCKPETTKSSDPLAEYLATNTVPSFVTDSSNAVGNASLSNPFELPAPPAAAPGSLVGGSYSNPPALGATSAAPVTGFADPIVPTPTPGGGSGVVGTPMPATGGYVSPGTLPMDGGFGSPAVEPAASSLAEHKVKSGESFSTMAKQYGVSVNAITAANPTLDPRRLKVGQVVLIPAAKPSAAPVAVVESGAAPAATVGTYTVQSGDNLTRIAAKHGMTVKALRSLNGLKTDAIKAGQKLKVTVPAGAGAGR